MYPKSHSLSVFIFVSLITQFISVHKYMYPFSCVWSSMSIKVYANYCPYSKSKIIFLTRYIFITGGCHHIWKIEYVTEVHVLWCCSVFLRGGVADLSCIGKDKGTVHVVVTAHGCISACLGLVLPFKCHHLMEPL